MRWGRDNRVIPYFTLEKNRKMMADVFSSGNTYFLTTSFLCERLLLYEVEKLEDQKRQVVFILLRQH
jgi:hypothetical protein